MEKSSSLRTFEQVNSAMKDIRLEAKGVCSPNIESNTILRAICNNSDIEDTTPVEKLIALDGLLDVRRIKVLKDIVSQDFFEKNKNNSTWK